MTYQSRNNVIKEFRDKEETHIMIASLKCGGVGLNLTMANRVICIGKIMSTAFLFEIEKVTCF